VEAVSWAAAMGYEILMDPHSSFAEIRAKYDQYAADRAEHGFPPPGDTPMARLLAVAATDEEAERVAHAGAAWTIGAYAHAVAASQSAAGAGRSAAASGRADDEVAARIEGYVRDRIIWGSPARVRDELARLREEMHLHYLMIAPLSHESFVRFTDEVMVHL